jgi:hypothetical protein
MGRCRRPPRIWAIGVVASRSFSSNVATFEPYNPHFFPDGSAFTLGQGAVVPFMLVDEPTSGRDSRRRIELLVTRSRMWSCPVRVDT